MSGIYVASKTVHGPAWRVFRSEGYPICSTWIDESEPGQTSDWADLWARCIREASEADALVLVYVTGEILKGALIEVGVALAHSVPVFWCGPKMSICAHDLVTAVDTPHEALNQARALYQPRSVT